MIAATLTEDYYRSVQTNQGSNLAALTKEQPILLVFLRHFGCVFCKEALHDIAANRPTIEQHGVKIVFVHLAEESIAKTYFDDYNMGDAPRISDPEKHIYKSFGVVRGSIGQLYGLSTWIKGFSANRKGHKSEYDPLKLGDARQMPGVFLISDSKIMESYIHKKASDQPDYLQLISCCSTDI